MDKRNGIDQYGIFLIWLGIITTVISYFLKSTFLSSMGLVFGILAVMRALTPATPRKKLQNQQFLDAFVKPIKKALKNPVKPKRSKSNKKADKDHVFVACPTCSQKLRLPKNKGKVKVKCPKCNTKFEAKS